MNQFRFSTIFPKSIHIWLPIIGIFSCLLLLSLANFVNNGVLLRNLDLYSILREGWLILIQVITTLYFVYYSIQYFDKKFGIQFSVKRYFYEIIFVVLMAFLINRIFLNLFLWIIVIPGMDSDVLNTRLHNLLIVSQVLVLLIYTLLTGFRIIKSLQQKQIEILKLQKEFTQTEFEALKNQLNPHFLFNSLSVLTSLVYSDANKAEKFIEKLSATYRYLLDQREKEAVHISEELHFLENYEYLITQRFGDKLKITKDFQNPSQNYYLLPHTFLIILEYILGTNTMSLAKPLTIEINCNNQFLLFRYTLQSKTLQHRQLMEQFQSLQNSYRDSGSEIFITTDEFLQQVLIKIPLIIV